MGNIFLNLEDLSHGLLNRLTRIGLSIHGKGNTGGTNQGTEDIKSRKRRQIYFQSSSSLKDINLTNMMRKNNGEEMKSAPMARGDHYAMLDFTPKLRKYKY